MMQLKQSTAVNIPFFMADSTDSITGKTGLSPTVTLSKNGAGFVSPVGSVTEIGLGWYYLAAASTGANDVGTLGTLLLHATATGADPWDEAHQVFVDISGGAVASVTGAVGSVTGAVGSVTGAVGSVTAVVSANLTQILGTALTETSGLLAAGFKKFFNVATPTGTVNSLPDAVPGATNGVFIAGTNAATSVTTSLTANIIGNITGNLSGSVGSVTAGVTLAAAAVTAIWDKLTSALTTSGSIGKLLVDNIDATISSRLASGSYTAPPSAATIAAAIWDYLTSAISTVGSIGKLIKDNLDATVSSRAPSSTALSTADWSNGRAALIDNLDTTVSSRASQSSVNNIQNNTSFAGIVQSPMILPPSGSKVYPFYVRLFDEIGAPIDPDTNIMNYTIKDSSGSIVVAQAAMTRTGVGQYTASYAVNSSDTERALFFFFDYAVNSVAFNQVRSTEVQEFESKLDTLVSRLTAQRALNLDNLDASISSRLATSGYATPDNSGIAAIKAKTDQLNFTGSNVQAVASVDLSPVQTVVDAIKTQTDLMQFDGNNILSRVQVNYDKTGYSLADGSIAIMRGQVVESFSFIMTNFDTHEPMPGLSVLVEYSLDGSPFQEVEEGSTEIGSGAYSIYLDGSETNGAVMILKFSAEGADTRFCTIVTQPT